MDLSLIPDESNEMFSNHDVESIVPSGMGLLLVERIFLGVPVSRLGGKEDRSNITSRARVVRKGSGSILFDTVEFNQEYYTDRQIDKFLKAQRELEPLLKK